MTRKQNAFAGRPELPDQSAQGAGRHDVQAVTRFIEDDVARLVHKGARQSDFCSLPLRKAFRSPVGEISYIELLDNFLHAFVDDVATHAVQLRVVSDIFSRGQMRIQAGGVRQCADLAAGFQAFGDDVDAVDRCRARIRFEYRVQNPEGSRFAGAIRPEQTRDAAIVCFEADAVDSFYVAEGLAKAMYGNHGSGPEKSRKKGITN